MKKLLSWVKTVVFGARARLLSRSRCSRAGRQFRFLTLTESSSDLVDSASVLDDPAVVSDVRVGEFHDEDVRTDLEEDRDVFFQLGDGEKDNLVAEDEDDEELEEAEEEEQEEEEPGESSDHGVVVLRRVFRTCRRKMSRVTVVSFLWSLLSLLVAGACAFSFYHPSWIAHPDRLHSFGLFTQCVRDPGSSYPRAVCHGYGPGGRVDLGSVPAGAWQASSLLYGAGMCLQGLGALVSLALLLLPSHPYSGRRVALLCGYVQTLAVLLLLSGLVMFPLGFSTDFFHYYCGETAGLFCLGHCRLGWSYVLAITATALAVFCPVLSNYTDVPLLTSEDEETGQEKENDEEKKKTTKKKTEKTKKKRRRRWWEKEEGEKREREKEGEWQEQKEGWDFVSNV